jgi:hypothetical protein
MTFIEVEKNKISTRNETETMKSLISAQPIQLDVQTKTRLKYKVTSESETEDTRKEDNEIYKKYGKEKCKLN